MINSGAIYEDETFRNVPDHLRRLNDVAFSGDGEPTTYRNFDAVNLTDNHEARDALINTGIESVPFEIEKYEAIREVLAASNRALGESGAFSLETYEEMMGYIAEYRSQAAAVVTEPDEDAGFAED